MKKSISFLSKAIIVLLCLSMLFSCSKNNNADIPKDSEEIDNFTDTEQTVQLSADELSSEIDKLMVNASKLTKIGNEYIELILELDTSVIADSCVKVQTAGTEADQYGIFVCGSAEDANKIAEQLNNYLNTLRDSWDNFDYLPEEAPKIAAAEVRKNSCSVCYVIASENEKSGIFNLFDNTILTY